jgi:hypothetical protein
VRPDARELLLIQGFLGAETPGSCGSYRAAKDSGVSDPTDSGVKSCFWPSGLLFNSTSSTVRPDGRYLLLIQSLSRAETPGSRDSHRAAKDSGVSDPTDGGVKS